MHGQLFFLHFIPHVWVSYLCELSVATSMKKQEEEKKKRGMKSAQAVTLRWAGTVFHLKIPQSLTMS